MSEEQVKNTVGKQVTKSGIIAILRQKFGIPEPEEDKESIQYTFIRNTGNPRNGELLPFDLDSLPYDDLKALRRIANDELDLIFEPRTKETDPFILNETIRLYLGIGSHGERDRISPTKESSNSVYNSEAGGSAKHSRPARITFRTAERFDY